MEWNIPMWGKLCSTISSLRKIISRGWCFPNVCPTQPLCSSPLSSMNACWPSPPTIYAWVVTEMWLRLTFFFYLFECWNKSRWSSLSWHPLCVMSVFFILVWCCTSITEFSHFFLNFWQEKCWVKWILERKIHVFLLLDTTDSNSFTTEYLWYLLTLV